jgi:SAM-dependent methyltransferase
MLPLTDETTDARPRPAALRKVQLDRCPVCECSSAAFFFSAPDLLVGVPGLFEYVCCMDCATVYQNPRVSDEDLLDCYPDAYFTHVAPPTVPTGGLGNTGSLRDILRRAVLASADGWDHAGAPLPVRLIGSMLARLPAMRNRARYGLMDALAVPRSGDRRCLEIGSGQGLTLLQLRRVGWHAFGLDIDPRAAAVATATSGCEVRVGKLAAAPYPAAYFQMLHMSHVVEHLSELKASLARCLDLLVPGGRLVLVYPNPRSLTARRYGRFSWIWDPPRHLVLPPARAMARLLRETGFVQHRVSSTASKAAGYHQMARRYRRGKRGVGFEAGRTTVADHLFALMERALVWGGWPVGEEVVMVAHKPTRSPE